MSNYNSKSMFILGVFIFLGLSSLGYFLGSSAIKYKEYERTVTVKGLSQKEVASNIVLWPIKFTVASNDLSDLYNLIDNDTKKVIDFLKINKIKTDEITIYNPIIIDKVVNSYSSSQLVKFRYFASRVVNVYSKEVQKIRLTMNKLPTLGKQGISFSGNGYDNQIEYIYTNLNDIKPIMIEEATRKAREVALKFAKDSNSKLGKIKKARQGQFSISSRDRNTAHIKKIRVVSTIEYYLSD